jgi:hypothetical protein
MHLSSWLTGAPLGSSMGSVRLLVRLVVVAFTIVSLLVVAAVGVAASSGKEGSANAVKHSVVEVFSGHFDLAGVHEGTTTSEGRHGGGQDECKPHKKHHKHVTGDRENDQCDSGGDDSGSSG